MHCCREVVVIVLSSFLLLSYPAFVANSEAKEVAFTPTDLPANLQRQALVSKTKWSTLLLSRSDASQQW